MPVRTYATVSIYTSSDSLLASVLSHLEAAPTRQSSKNDLLGIHYSTKDKVNSLRTEDHLAELVSELRHLPDIVKFHKTQDREDHGTLEVRLWIYFETKSENEDFSLSASLIDWLHSVDGDVCVDVWR